MKELFSLLAVYAVSGCLLVAGALLLAPLISEGRGRADKGAVS